MSHVHALVAELWRADSKNFVMIMVGAKQPLTEGIFVQASAYFVQGNGENQCTEDVQISK